MGMTNALNLLCGLALFLYGMHVMGEGLTRASGGKLESILESLTKSKIKAVLLGAGVTAIIQSSSATTVMVVGFVNSGIMRLSQAAGVIMGANIGTTVTSWILSLTGLQGDSLLLTLCKPATFTPVLAFIGVCLLLFAILLYAGFCRLFYEIAGFFVNFIQINRICLYCPIIKLLFDIYCFAVIRLLCL